MQSLSVRPGRVHTNSTQEETTPLSQQKPALFIIAGPLGAGKTTFYEAYLKEAFPMLLPAVRNQRLRILNEQRSFAVEDIRVDTELLDEAKAAGYTTKVLFISTEDANLNVGRVLVRMSRGGQGAPVSSVIDSYRESTKNLSEVRKRADELILYDNTAHNRGHRAVAHFIGGKLSKVAQTIPDWAAKVFGKEIQPAKQHAKPGRDR
jgi:predicted ABC-type ATPase